MIEKALIYIISDGTGETASAMVRAAIAQYGDREINIIRNKNVRTEQQMATLIDEAFQRQGLVVFTVASAQMRKKVLELASDKGVPCVDLLGPLMTEMDHYFGVPSLEGKAGILRQVDQRYFKRIEAIEYTVKHDDGKCLTDLDQADIVLLGISRTSKTPLSIFLGHKGWKVANIPIVANTPVPTEIFAIDQRRIVGLIIESENLHRIRRRRLEKFGQDPGNEYARISYIQKEVEYAMDLFRQNKRWPVINVTERALEETAAEIAKIISSRLGLPEDVLF